MKRVSIAVVRQTASVIKTRKGLGSDRPLCLGIIVTFLAAGLANAAVLSVNEASAPSTGVITSSPQAGSFTRSFHDNNGKITRGSTFLAPDTGDANTAYGVTGLTIKKNADQTFASGDSVELWVFAYNPSNNGNDTTSWVLGDGMDVTGTPGGDSDPLNGTGCTSLLAESFDLSGQTLNNGTFITFDFSAAPLTMSENTAYGFLIGFASGGSGPTYFQFEQINVGSFGDGKQIRTVGTSNTVDNSIDTTFYLTGTAIPEPATLSVLALGLLGLVASRRIR